MKTSLIHLDAHVLFTQGLCALLATNDSFEITSSFLDGKALVDQWQKGRPCIAIVEINTSGALSAIVHLRESGVPVLILSSSDETFVFARLMRAGISGYHLKSEPFETILRALTNIKKGMASFTPKIASRLARACRAEWSSEILSPRETQIIQFIARGKPTKEISSCLGLSIKVVDHSRMQAMQKLGLHDIAAVTRYAHATGMLDPACGS